MLENYETSVTREVNKPWNRDYAEGKEIAKKRRKRKIAKKSRKANRRK